MGVMSSAVGVLGADCARRHNDISALKITMNTTNTVLAGLFRWLTMTVNWNGHN